MANPRTIPGPVLKELSGVTPTQFARLVEEVGAAYEAARFERLERPGRRRVQGAGRKHAVPFSARLLMVLMYLRWNISYRALGGLFGVSKDAVLRSMDDLLPLLAERGITAPDGTAVVDRDRLSAQLESLTDAQRGALVDGTFVPVGRPAGWEAQKPFYNPHRGRHTRNFTALTDDAGNLLWVGGTGPGSLHDLTAIAGSTAAGPLADSKVTVVADKAYRGIAKRMGLAKAFTPKTRRRKNQPAPSSELASAEADFNREVAAVRVHVEHAIRRLKVRRVLHGYRLSPRRFDHVIAAVASLATMPA